MRYWILIYILVGLIGSGCQAVKGTSSESVVDSNLSQSQPPAPAPLSEPAEPQKGFDQEVEQALNP